MNDKIVLICATGRSGSTTLQRILNTIPNTNICGENYGAINCLLEFYIKLHASSRDFIPGNFNPLTYTEVIEKQIKPAWYNSFNLKEIGDKIRETIITMFKNSPNINMWGFKEIRYDNKKINLLKIFKILFPQTKIIIQIRENIKAQSKSGWHKKDKNAIPFLTKTSKELIHFALQNREWCYLTSFEKMFDKNNLKNIFYFIGCGDKFNEDEIDIVLKNNLKD